MHAFIFFSVYERLFDPIARELAALHGVTKFSGFCWGRDQAAFLEESTIKYAPFVVFSRDVLPRIPKAPDLAYLAGCETRYGVPIHRLIAAERHLIAGRSYDEVLCLVETIFRTVETTFDEAKPDFIFSENVACLTSYIHHIVARQRGIPFWSIAQSRLRNRPLIVYRDGLQEFADVRERFATFQTRDLSPSERADAIELVTEFRERPRRLAGQEVHARVPTVNRNDLSSIARLWNQPVKDDGNPTRIGISKALAQRGRRLARISVANMAKVFGTAPLDRPYVLYPLHVQPEASTLVQAPYYLDQIALIEDLVRSLPVGHQLYVKEHASSRGRRPLDYYGRIKKILGVTLFGPDEPVWPLIQNAAAIVVITGTMGWEGVLMKKPVITFGNVFFNDLPMVYKAKDFPKDQWADVFRTAIFSHVHDEEQLLKYVAALYASCSPGEMFNPGTVARVMDPDNIRMLVDALVRAIGLPSAQATSSVG